LLRDADLRLHEAQVALDASAPGDVADRVARVLVETDDLFAALVRCWELDGGAAQAIESVRDELSSSVVAVIALERAEMPVVGVLRRAVDAARSRVVEVVDQPVR
jgi:hypothetical protein